jgi:hypothetical protein
MISRDAILDFPSKSVDELATTTRVLSGILGRKVWKGGYNDATGAVPGSLLRPNTAECKHD